MTCPCFKSFCCSISCEHSDLQFSKKWRTGDSCSIQGDCCLVIFNRTPDLAKRLQWGSMHISSGRCLHRLSLCSFLMCEPSFQKLIHSWRSGLCAAQGGKGPLSLESHCWLPLYPAFCWVFVKAPLGTEGKCREGVRRPDSLKVCQVAGVLYALRLFSHQALHRDLGSMTPFLQTRRLKQG